MAENNNEEAEVKKTTVVLRRSSSRSSSLRSRGSTANSVFVDYDYLIKVVIVGDSGVGKSQLVARFTRNEFTSNSRQTIGVEFATKTITVDDKNVCAQLWDTAGEERYRALASAYYRGAVGVLLVYDVTNPRSFQNLAHWLSEVRSYTTTACQIVLVGNKIDLRAARKITEGQARAFAHANDMSHLETSALDSTNVEASFTQLVSDIYRKTISTKPPGAGSNLNPHVNGQLRLLKADNSPSTTDRIKSKCCSVD